MTSKDKLKELLNYSTALSSSSNAPADGAAAASTDAAGRPKLDAAMLDQIMGPDDAQLMLQSMAAIESPIPHDELEVAFENLEALVEQIDNAKNLQNLKLWTPLIAQLHKSDAVYRVSAASVIATALQNNPTSQQDFLTYNDGLKTLLHLFASDADVRVRRKAAFALTSALRNCPAAMVKFEALEGWQVISRSVSEPGDLAIQRRLVFFLGAIYAALLAGEEQTISTAVKTGFPPKLVTLLAQDKVQDDEDLAEKIIYTLVQSLKYDSDVLNRELKDKLKTLASAVEQRYGEEFFPGRELDGML